MFVAFFTRLGLFYFMAYVYRHTRLDKNEVFYIGIGSDERGKYNRAYSKTGRNKHWYNIINLTNYKVEIISEDWLTWEEACEKEKFWITFYGRADLGRGSLVNITDGGDGQFNPSFDTRKKMSVAKLGYSLSEKHRHNIGKSLIGHKYNQGKKHTPERIEKQRSSMIGKKHTQDTIEKCRQSKMGNKNPNFGKSPKNKGVNISKELKDKIRNSIKTTKRVQSLETDEIFDSMVLAARHYNVSRSLLYYWNNNKYKIKIL